MRNHFFMALDRYHVYNFRFLFSMQNKNIGIIIDTFFA